MKKLLAIVVVTIVTLPATGCVSRSLVKLARELKNDPATLNISLSSPWGPQNLTRIGGQTNNAVDVTPPKVTVKPQK